MQIVNLSQEPNQKFKTVVAEQNCEITLRTIGGLLYFSMSLNGVDFINSRVCRNGGLLVPTAYLGFKGNFSFVDYRGDTDPTYDLLNDRYFLLYLEESDFA